MVGLTFSLAPGYFVLINNRDRHLRAVLRRRRRRKERRRRSQQAKTFAASSLPKELVRL